MSTNTESLQRIEALKAEIASLERTALQELMDRRNALSQELAAVDRQIEELTGNVAPGKSTRTRAPKAPGKSLPLQELKERLASAPDRTLNVRKEGLDLAGIKTLVSANPQLLKLGGKGPWPTVTLLK